jgi:hypothetical protein
MPRLQRSYWDFCFDEVKARGTRDGLYPVLSQFIEKD